MILAVQILIMKDFCINTEKNEASGMMVGT